jgi:hypothetical protein
MSYRLYRIRLTPEVRAAHLRLNNKVFPKQATHLMSVSFITDYEVYTSDILPIKPSHLKWAFKVCKTSIELMLK